jgi:hypothetical protein
MGGHGEMGVCKLAALQVSSCCGMRD